MPVALSIEDFLQEVANGNKVILDTRSPAEHAKAHMPGAISFPLLNNEERAIIGTIYKKEGRESAVIKGFELVGPKFSDFIKLAKELAPAKEIYLYCWRGGMRSNILAWILGTAGFRVLLLKGGYKTYRQWVLKQFHNRKNIVVIGGKTGSGKTELLNEMEALGEQVIDLEKLANHKGSAFGALGKPPQPSTEHFENLIAQQWNKFNTNKKIWIENESFKIGTCVIPLALYQQMRIAPVIEICMEHELRLQRILKEYGHFNKTLLAEKTTRLKKKLGGLRLKEALGFLEQGNMEAWCNEMLWYYDKTYQHSDDERNQERKQMIELKTQNMKQNACRVLELIEQNSTADNKLT